MITFPYQGFNEVGGIVAEMGSGITAPGSRILSHGIGISTLASAVFCGIRDQAVPFL